MRFVGIDPSTKTGFVALNEDGEELVAKEIIGVGKEDPHRMRTMIVKIMREIKEDDVISIEGFGFASQQAIQIGGIGWGIRMALHAKGFNYYEVAPNAVKKFVGVTGWEGETGAKTRLSNKEKKKAVIQAVFEHYAKLYKSDNVADAYVLARIAKDISSDTHSLPEYQQEVIQTILHPPAKKPKVKKKVAK